MSNQEVGMAVEYGGIKIEYVEKTNQWVFELRGRERKVESLAKAKEAIDKPVKEDKKPFERMKVYYKERWVRDGENEFKIGEITSIAAVSWGVPGETVWLSKGKDDREKVGIHSLFEISEKNEAIIAEINKTKAEIAQLVKKVDSLETSMVKAKIPSGEE